MRGNTTEKLRAISTPTLTTQLFKLGFRNTYLTGLRPLCPETRMAGVAVTMRFAPAREDLATFAALADPAYPQRRAIEGINPGEVLVNAPPAQTPAVTPPSTGSAAPVTHRASSLAR